MAFHFTSIPILVQIPYVADRYPKHRVICPVETDGPSLVIPVAEGVQVHIYSPTYLCFAVKEVRSSHNQICPAGGEIIILKRRERESGVVRVGERSYTVRGNGRLMSEMPYNDCHLAPVFL